MIQVLRLSRRFYFTLALLLLAEASNTGAAHGAVSPWSPGPGVRFDVQFDEPFALSRPTDVLELDLFDSSPDDIARLKADGVRLVCYINMGAWENWRNDADKFPPQVIGKVYDGWPGERWLDIRAVEVLAPLLLARLDLCRAKGFDAVEPDNINGHDNPTGFAITRAQQVRFNLWLAEQAHRRGLSIALKNAPDLLPELANVYDWALTEDCFSEGWCADFAPVISAGKAVFALEYTDLNPDWPNTWAKTCAEARSLGITVLLKKRSLDGWLHRCK
jgi:endo-alpha-1,4-polygalactosaminidase (GH114 family)